jgi:Erv1/Alr family protein
MSKNASINPETLVTCNDLHIYEITEEQMADAVRRAHDKDDPDSGNGLITKIWGDPTWESFHSIQFGFPIEPSQEQMEDYLAYFKFLGKVLPCIFCRKSYQKFIAEDGICPLTMDVMRSRESLTKWGHCLHNCVNKKLGVDYGVTYPELCYKYESFRAKCTKTGKGCLMPLNLKSKSYQNADIKRAPIVDPVYSLALIPHARTLGLKNYESMLDKVQKLERNSESWMVRDIMAVKITKYMRINGISALDDSGLPSLHEMILLSLLSTTLEKEKLDEIIKLLSYISSEEK